LSSELTEKAFSSACTVSGLKFIIDKWD